MSERPRRDGPLPPGDEPPGDEEYARAYAAGYEEGLRSGLREILQHTSRGHTAQELRILVESRLARVPEEAELKRRSLLGPPRRPAWNALLRPPAPARPWTEPVGAAPAARLAPGRSVLVKEVRPARALELLAAHQAEFPRVAVVSLHPPELPGLAPERRLVLSPRGASGGHVTPGELSGQLKEPAEADGGALVYVDALEYFASEDGPDLTFRFVTWLVELAQRTGSALLVSLDPRALDVRDASRLERLFAQVVVAGGAGPLDP